MDVSSDYEKEWDCINLNMRASFGVFKECLENELDRIYIPTKDEDPVEIDINLSINWF